MKKVLFLLMLMLAANPSFAEITLEETTDAEYLINAGYSQTIAEDVFMLKSRNLGKPIEPLYEKPDNFVVRNWRKFFSYLDPAQESFDRLHHDIKQTPHFSDL